ncbi:MAG: hypothetical protein IT462_16345, partial [Planctomycetes bacterium]|nr:hypothetical protein [Planctomycetota bacterium]
ATAWLEATLSERDAEMPTGKAPLALFRHAPNVASPQAETGTVILKML